MWITVKGIWLNVYVRILMSLTIVWNFIYLYKRRSFWIAFKLVSEDGVRNNSPILFFPCSCAIPWMRLFPSQLLCTYTKNTMNHVRIQLLCTCMKIKCVYHVRILMSLTILWTQHSDSLRVAKNFCMLYEIWKAFDLWKYCEPAQIN